MDESCRLQGGRPEPQSLPWYGVIKGFALVPQKGAIEAGSDPAAVLVLMEGGQLVLFDLPDLQPVPLNLPLQELPDLTILRLACSPAEAGPGSLGLHAATLERIRVTCRTAIQPNVWTATALSLQACNSDRCMVHHVWCCAHAVWILMNGPRHTVLAAAWNRAEHSCGSGGAEPCQCAVSRRSAQLGSVAMGL